MAITRKDINKHLARTGHPVEIERGEGYIYFIFDDGRQYHTHTINVPYLSDYTVDQWVDMGTDFAKAVVDGRYDASRDRIREHTSSGESHDAKAIDTKLTPEGAMAKTYTYTVRGHWPFPADMLRKDQSVPHGEADRQQVEDMSSDHCKDRTAFNDVEITLTGPCLPAVERWNSFKWIVVDIQQNSGTRKGPVAVYPSVDMQQQKKQVGVVELTPTWTAIMPALIAVLEDGTEEGKRQAREELMSLARAVDAQQKAKAA